MGKNRFFLVGLLSFLVGLSSCEHSKPNFIYMWEMVYSPSYKAQEDGSMKMPPAGTIPRDYKPYHITDPEQAGRELSNPFKPTKQVLLRGQKLYDTYCVVCHGAFGEGDGPVSPKFGRPPSLQARPMEWPDGQIYHVMTKGQNLMPSYASQIVQEDRWKLIHYIRAIQRAKHPTSDDLKQFEQRAGQ